ncbi:hypothetical protein, partial [Arthrobacter sp.]|uniref:hypothetical protein n=1 Tax=Arthrobacter sp. TaxID=1667 RepID=UPI0026DF7E5C
RMGPGEWTEKSMDDLVASYQQKLHTMGAPDDQIKTSVETFENGSANVHVSWQRTGTQTFAETGQSLIAETEGSRGQGEHIPAGETTADSKGLGAVLGDADRSAIDAPPTQRAMNAEKNQQTPELLLYTDEEGKTYVEEVDPAKE